MLDRSDELRCLEQRIVRALQWLKANTAGTPAKLRTIAAALVSGGSDDAEAMQRMQLAAPSGMKERLTARLLRLALRRTA